MSRKSILYIINPISGTRTKKNLQAFLEQKTTEAGIPYHIEYSVASADYSFLLPIIKEKDITDVGIAGGDGTVSQVVNGLMGLDLNFGIFPCGSGNGLALAAGIPRAVDKALQVFLHGQPMLTDGFLINGQFACMLSGLGFDAKVAHDFARQPKRGLSTYARQVVKNFFKARFYDFTIELPGKQFQTTAFFISIANSNQFGNQFTIAPKASLSDGLLDIVVVSRQSKLKLLLQTLRQIRGWNALQPAAAIDTSKAILYFQTASIRIANNSKAPLHIDGDPADTPDQVIIEVKEKCFRLICPA
ncbi:MAG: diacylglycerol kinase family protein [Chitinophagaceae bacterium]